MAEEKESKKSVKCKLALAEPKKFIDSLASIGKMVDEVEIKFGKDGISIKAMDQANVAMVCFDCKSSVFTEYECPEESKYGIQLSKFNSFLKRVEDTLDIEFADRITIKSTGKRNKKFEVPVVEIDEEEKKVPNMDFKATAKVKVDDLKSSIEDAELVGESIKILCKKGKFGILSESELETASVDMVPTEVVVADGEAIASSYSIEYLQKIMNNKIAKETTLRFGKDYPIKIEFKDENLTLYYILAPRVDND